VPRAACDGRVELDALVRARARARARVRVRIRVRVRVRVESSTPAMSETRLSVSTW